MTEEVTYGRNGCSFTLELNGKRVTEAVSVNSLIDLRLAGQARQQMADVALVDFATEQGAEDRCAPVDSSLPSYLEPAGKERGSSNIDAHDPPFVALAVLHDERTRVEVEVFRA